VVVAVTAPSPQFRLWAREGARPANRLPRPAALASARVSRASLLLGALALISAAFVLVRLFESWRVTPGGNSHRISIFGQRLTYPTANTGAIVMVALAVVGLAVTALTVYGAVRELIASRRFLRRMSELNPSTLGDALVIDDERPRAFCAGLIRPRVYISTAGLALLDESGLEAVLAHERHHARRRDPLRLGVARVLARALFLLPGLTQLIERQQALAELSADEAALNARPANRAGLAAAMLSFSDPTGSGSSVGIDPARVDHLLGEDHNWRFPLALCLVCVAVITLLLATGVLAARVAQGTATLAPPFLSAQPCIVVLAAIPAVASLAVIPYLRSGRAKRRNDVRRTAD
jgi:BlaR1 peptidase M56